VLVTVIALGVVFFAARGGKSDDRVSASGSTTSTGVASPLAVSSVATTAGATTEAAIPSVRVIELAETVGPTAPPTTSAPTTAKPTTVPPTTAKPKPKPTTTAKPKPTTTATTAPTTTVLDTAPPASAPPSNAPVDPSETTIAVHVQDGRGTFHRYDNTDPQWGERPCAHRTLPKGTIVTVVNVKTGASTWCIVKDRGPYGNAIIDLDEEQFVEIAPVGAGIINVRITW
jgi:outer membrane biosynthesis protein TonB